MASETFSTQQHRHRRIANSDDETLTRPPVGAVCEMSSIELTDSECNENNVSFFQAFKESKVGFQIVFLTALLAMGEGAVIGVVRVVETTRKARVSLSSHILRRYLR
jgi:hypothetical protein